MTCGAAPTGPGVALFLELSRSPPDRGGDAFGGDDVAEFLPEFGLGRIERADDVEPGVERGAEAGGVGAAIDRTLRRVERLRGDQRQPLGIAQARLAQLGERNDTVD